MVHSYFSQVFQSEDYEVNEAVLNALKLLFSYEEVKHTLFRVRLAELCSLILW
jgi:hypothetical protein